jgi:hypothetical protein
MNSKPGVYWIFIIVLFALVLAGCGSLVGNPTQEGGQSIPPQDDNDQETREYRIITLLPKDAIPSINNPRFYSVEEADQEYDPEEIVLGVVFDGEARAYSVNMLSSHEIVNDVVAGKPIAVTW